MIEDSAVQHDLPKVGCYFLKWSFKARDCALNFDKEMPFSNVVKGVVSKIFRGQAHRLPFSPVTHSLATETLKPMLKPPCPPWCVFASHT